MKYIYKRIGRTVEIGQMFDSHWNYTDPLDSTGLVRQGEASDFVPLAEAEPVAVEPELPEIKVVPQIEEVVPTPGFVKLINLNTETSPAVIALHLPGIGKIWAKKICDRKSKGGYQDFDHFQKVNSDLNLDEAGWEKIKELVEF